MRGGTNVNLENYTNTSEFDINPVIVGTLNGLLPFILISISFDTLTIVI